MFLLHFITFYYDFDYDWYRFTATWTYTLKLKWRNYYFGLYEKIINPKIPGAKFSYVLCREYSVDILCVCLMISIFPFSFKNQDVFFGSWFLLFLPFTWNNEHIKQCIFFSQVPKNEEAPFSGLLGLLRRESLGAKGNRKSKTKGKVTFSTHKSENKKSSTNLEEG